MAGTVETAGRVDFIASLDGRNAVQESRALGEKIGQEGEKAGAGFGDKFESGFQSKLSHLGDDLAKKLELKGKLAGEKFGDSLDNALQVRFRRMQSSLADILTNDDSFRSFAKGFDDVGDAVSRATADLSELSKAQVLARDEQGDLRYEYVLTEEQFRASSAAIERMGVIVAGERKREAELAAEAENLTVKMDKLDESVKKQGLHWRNLSHGTRRWTLIIGAVASGMQELSVLSSAAGAGLLGLGGALSTAVLGAGASAAVFSVLAKDVGDLPPSLREAASEFKSLGSAFKGTRDIIASSAIQQMPDTFSRMQSAVEALAPSFSRLGTSVGKVFEGFSKGTAEGTEGFKEIQRLIDNAASDFPALADAAGTWSVALMRGLNEANPLAKQLIGYVDLLGDRFDAFTKSDSFDQWVRTSMQTFTDFGELLDATGRALNDLVTPASAVRTQEFLDNLTEFMPNLSRLLDIFGRVDLFGLAAQLLNDFGAALEPLAGPVGELADTLNEVAEVVIGTLADALGLVATLIAPVVQGLSDFISAIPPDVLSAITIGVLAVAGAFVTLKGAQGIAGAASALGLFGDAAGVVSGKAGSLAGGLKGIVGKAGLWGGIALGAIVATEAVFDFAKSLTGIDDVTRNVLASGDSMAKTFNKVAESQKGMRATFLFGIEDIKDWGPALDDLNDGWAQFIGVSGSAGTQAMQLKIVLEEMDKPLANLANSNLPAAQEQFASWANEMGASESQVLNMINTMPAFKKSLEDAALSSGQLATEQELVRIALEGLEPATDANAEALDLLGSSAELTGGQIDDLSQKILGFGQVNLDARESARNYQEALDDMAASIATNGATLDINTQEGRANEEQLDRLSEATLTHASNLLKQTGDQDQANAAISAGRQALIDTLATFGVVGPAAEAYADSLGLIPAKKPTAVEITGATEAQNLLANIAAPRVATVTVKVVDNLGRSTNLNQLANIRLPATATGGTFSGAQARIIGEAGPEAVVPLRRPLGQVDPSVRWLSAMAQGRKIPAMASGGIVGGGNTVIFESGSIVVEGAEDPRITAIEVTNEIAERIGS